MELTDRPSLSPAAASTFLSLSVMANPNGTALVIRFAEQCYRTVEAIIAEFAFDTSGSIDALVFFIGILEVNHNSRIGGDQTLGSKRDLACGVIYHIIVAFTAPYFFRHRARRSRFRPESRFRFRHFFHAEYTGPDWIPGH